MVEIKKQVEIIINGDDVQVLSTICEFARCWIAYKKNSCYARDEQAWPVLGCNCLEELIKINDMLNKIFGA